MSAPKQYDISADQQMQLERAFMTIPDRDGWPEKFLKINDRIAQTAKALFLITPKSPEQTLALRKLQEAQFWFNESIKKNEL